MQYVSGMAGTHILMLSVLVGHEKQWVRKAGGRAIHCHCLCDLLADQRLQEVKIVMLDYVGEHLLTRGELDFEALCTSSSGIELSNPLGGREILLLIGGSHCLMKAGKENLIKLYILVLGAEKGRLPISVILGQLGKEDKHLHTV